MNKGLNNPINIKTVFLLLSYYFLVVFPHEIVGKQVAAVFSEFGRNQYNLIILFLFCTLASITGFYLVRKIIRDDRIFIMSYVLITLIIIVLSFKILLVFNVEAIHFIQYAIFAMICFKLNRSFLQTMIWSSLAGAFDELYQYLYLAPLRTEYYDFNDVIINTIGAGIGLIFIRASNNSSLHFNWRQARSSLIFKILLALIGIIVLGFATGYISNFYSDQAVFVLQKNPDIEFWHTAYMPKYKFSVKFHVVKPIEGLVITILIIIFYGFLQYGTKNEDIIR